MATYIPQGTVGSATPTLAVPAGGTDGTNLRILKTDANGELQIDVLTLPAVSGSVTVSGSVSVVPQTTGGLTTFHLEAAASTNATNLKASAGQVYGWYVFNNNTLPRKVAFHNTSGTPTAGSSIFFTLVIPGSSAANVFGETGIAFSSGIGITTVTGVADSDSTAVAADDLNINIWFK